jgi:CheY-like chemotaxis protein
VVDDTLDAAEPLMAFLQFAGYQASLARNATDALHVAAEFQPDLALLDIGMPTLDGWLLGGMLRALPGLAELPIIAITGYGGPADFQRSAAANFAHHLVKPLDYAVLGSLLKALEPASDARPTPPAVDTPSGSSRASAPKRASVTPSQEPDTTE